MDIDSPPYAATNPERLRLVSIDLIDSSDPYTEDTVPFIFKSKRTDLSDETTLEPESGALGIDG